MRPEFFLASHPVFSREEFAAALRQRGRTEATIDSHLTRWRRQGRVARVKPGVFLRLDGPDHAQAASADYFALAARMAPDAALGYHTALEAHGTAQSVFERFTFLTWTGARATSFRGRRFVPVKPRAPLRLLENSSAWTERMDRRGVEIRVTTIERTVVDVLDRPDLSGGVEEVWRSLAGVPAIDTESLEQDLFVLGNRTLVSKLGYCLETHRDELAVSDAFLKRLRARIPRAPVFMDRSGRGDSSRAGRSLCLPS